MPSISLHTFYVQHQSLVPGTIVPGHFSIFLNDFWYIWMQ